MNTDAKNHAPVDRAGRAFNSATACWNSTAARSASTALANSAKTPSPVSLTMRPPFLAREGSRQSPRHFFNRSSVPASSRPMSRA